MAVQEHQGIEYQHPREIDLALFYPLFASSCYDSEHGVEKARFDLSCSRVGGLTWSAGRNDENEFIGVSFCGSLVSVHGVGTQGKSEHDQYIKRYIVEYTIDGLAWVAVDEGRVFPANHDAVTITRHYFKPIQCRALRIQPIEWHNHISTKLAIFGHFP